LHAEGCVVVAVTVYIYFLLWQYPLYFEVAADTFGRGSIYFLLWQHLLFVVAADAFGRGSIHFLLWQYPLFVVETDTFGSGSIHFLLWQYPLCCGSSHLWPWQCPLFSVAVQVSWTKWCVAGATFGGIFKPYPLTISQQRIMLEQTAKCMSDDVILVCICWSQEKW